MRAAYAKLSVSITRQSLRRYLSRATTIVAATLKRGEQSPVQTSLTCIVYDRFNRQLRGDAMGETLSWSKQIRCIPLLLAMSCSRTSCGCIATHPKTAKGGITNGFELVTAHTPTRLDPQLIDLARLLLGLHPPRLLLVVHPPTHEARSQAKKDRAHPHSSHPRLKR